MIHRDNVKEQQAVAALCEGASFSEAMRLTGLTLDQIRDAWRRQQAASAQSPASGPRSR